MSHFLSTRRSELTSKEEQWRNLHDSLKKRIRELEDSREKGQRAHILISETSGGNISADMY